jgi:hypothetical protein
LEKMPTRANKSQSIAARDAKESSGGNKNSDKCGKPDSESADQDTSPACLCDSHEHPDDKWEIDKEELLHVEINGIFQDIIPSYETNNLSKDDSNEFVKFLGLETSEPIAQIGGTGPGGEAVTSSFFSGHYENTVGTSTFFTLEDSNTEEESKTDQVFSDGSEPQSKRIRYICKADKKLVLKRVFLNKKTTPELENADGEVLEAIKEAGLQNQTKFKPSTAGPSAAPSDLHNK